MGSQGGSIGDLVETARSRDPASSLQAAQKLEALPEPERFESMAAILTGANSLVTDLAASAMEGYGARGLEALLGALPQAKPLGQIKIVGALEHLGEMRAARPLMDLLAATDLSMLRVLIIQALGRIGAVEAVSLIRSFAGDPDHHVRERVAMALALLEKK
jgi:HEAT repeat protein